MHGFDAVTGLTNSIQTVKSPNAPVQNLTYAWDKWGPRPDVGVLYRDGYVKIIEVLSKTDEAAAVRLRNELKIVAGRLRGEMSTTKIAVWLDKVFGE